MPRIVCILSLMIAASLFGCAAQNAPAPDKAKVNGKVKLDGKEMAEGEVRFMVPGFPPTVFPIKGGAYSGEAYIGKNRVEIVLEKDGPPTTTDPKVLMKINTVTHQPLEADVKKDSGENTFSFEATTAPPPAPE